MAGDRLFQSRLRVSALTIIINSLLNLNIKFALILIVSLSILGLEEIKQ